MTDLEELVREYLKLSKEINALEIRKSALNREISDRVSEKKTEVADGIVRRFERLSIRTPIEVARGLGATKTEEVLDKDMLKSLHESGSVIQGITLLSFVQVSEKKKD
jgi:hypothetical protein